jgi:hypothetical protein
MPRFAILAVALISGAAALYFAGGSWAQEPGSVSRRAFVPMVAKEGSAEPAAPTAVPTVPRRPPPPPGEGYCGPSASSAAIPSPPNAIFGLLTIGGQPAPFETLVGLTFDGLPGPYEYTIAEGGYRVLYAAGGGGHEPRCINEVGTRIGVIVNGVQVDSPVVVGAPEDGGAGVAYRFDVAIP